MIMEPLNIDDIKLVTACGGNPVKEPERSQLKYIYSKLEYICECLPTDQFSYKIRKDPRSQGGGFKYFQTYLWAKIFPKEFENEVRGKLAVIIGIANDTLHLHIMGIGKYQDMEASQFSSTVSWDVLDLNNLEYENIVIKVRDFYIKNRDLFIQTATKIGIKYFIKLSNKLKMEKKVNLLTYKKQIILQGPPGTGKTREAKLIAKSMLELNEDELQKSEQFKLIQFHPSYTYEDFVRGIVAESKGEKIEYRSVNKTLGLFAEEALKNFENSKKVPELISKEFWIQEQYVKFKEYLESELEKSGELLIKNDTKPKITAIEVDAIRVNRYSNESDSVLIKDNDIINGYIGLHFSETIVKVKDNFALSKSARSGMYYLYQNLIEKFREFLGKENLSYHPTEDAKSEELKNYVLIIDEINRANLSSVLGELIYALEYRGEEVESMYEVDGTQKLILPPNLYIIGTMNTADRSVGHIDYAIRRRFAFVDVLPQKLKNSDEIIFNENLYKSVSELFVKDFNIETEYNSENIINNETYLSNEFSAKDVWLGHSYFIQKIKKDNQGNIIEKIPNDMSVRLDYEIKPILMEYVRDGVLKPSAIEVIKKISV